MNAIPTIYSGIQMRSRLEAQWAAFFDHMGWKWEYEPVDLKGWIPDFLLRTQSRVYYVEVKPITSRSEFDKYWPKIAKANPNHAVLLVGVKLFRDEYENGFENIISIGQIREKCCILCGHGRTGHDILCNACGANTQSVYEIQDCVIGKCFCGSIGFSAFDDLNGNFLSSCCSNYARPHEHISTEGDGNDVVLSAWSNAKNSVQWRPPK